MKAPSAAASRAALAPWFAARLIPLDGGGPATPLYSDYDLNPGSRSPRDPLRDAAVLVALVEREAGLSVVLTRRAEGLSRHPGQVAFPGGRLEPGETAAAAAIREAHEEVALDPRHVRAVGRGDAYETITGFAVTPIVAFVEPGATLEPSEGEVAEVFEAPFAWLMDPSNVQRRSREFAGVRRHFAALEFGDQLIWGATAAIIVGLRERLFS